jgi:PAS domain S-box-containing protein
MFRNLNIYKKLALVLWGFALTAFAVAGVGFALYQSLTLERRAMQAMEPYARLVSVGTEGAVAFEDPVRAQEILDTLRSNPEIRGAAIFLADGRILARFGSQNGTFPRPYSNKPDGISLSGDTAELRQSLPHGASLQLTMSLGGLKEQTRQILWLLAVAGLALLAVTFAQLAVLQRAIIQPVATLAEAAELVRTRADYDQQVPAAGDDEVAQLGRSFNAMMEAVRERERDLRRLALSQRTLLDSAAYGIISATPDGLVTSFNPAAERLLGYTADEVVGKQTPDIWHDPEEIARHALQLSEELGETILPGFSVFSARPRRNLPEENEWAFIRKDGTRVPVLLSVTALRDESGRITGFVGLTYDLTERNRAEEALREGEAFLNTLLNAIPIPVFYKDRDGRYLGFNRAYETFFGATRNQLIGKTVFDISPRELAESYRAKDIELFESGGVQQYESQVKNTHGVLCDIIFNKAVFTDSSGTVIGLIGAILDITGRKRAEEDIRRLNEELEQRVRERTADLNKRSEELSESQGALMNIVEDLNEKTGELEQANARLKELDRLKSMFIASMSHELRTPLNSVIGFSSVLLNEWVGPINAEQKENLAIILRSGKHLLNLINDVIDVSKIEAGKIESSAEEFDLHDLVSEAVSLVKEEFGEKGLDLRVAAAHQQMRSDRRRLLQCVLNLLSNAVKFTEQGGVTVEARIVKVSGATQDAGVAEISVTDTGIGIREEDIGKMFQPFVRLSSPLQATVPGTGLGLYLTRKLAAEVLKGDILLTSEYGKGSRFTIRIPLGAP